MLILVVLRRDAKEEPLQSLLKTSPNRWRNFSELSRGAIVVKKSSLFFTFLAISRVKVAIALEKLRLKLILIQISLFDIMYQV